MNGWRSLSARRAWIEIKTLVCLAGSVWSLSARRAWIEIVAGTRYDRPPLSLSARRAWIEMLVSAFTNCAA